MQRNFFTIIIFSACISLITGCRENGKTKTDFNTDLTALRRQEVLAALNQKIPVIKLRQTDDKNAEVAQELAIAFPAFQKQMRAADGTPYKNEIFQSKPLTKADQLFSSTPCKEGNCYKVELYNYALNQTTIAIVEPCKNKVHKVIDYPQTQPELPQHLAALAVYIAGNDAEVINALGYKPTADDALMERTKSSLNKTRCERSMHLCVAPTYVAEPKALWAIVDLTDEVLVGTRWTEVGKTGLPITERRLQNDNITENYCDKENTYEKENWKFSFIMTNSDGLMIYDAYFKGEKVLNSMKLVDWHVSYSKSDGFGYSDAIGCPFFSSSAVVAVEPPEFLPLLSGQDTSGFIIEQSYWSEGWPAPCNYNYKQKFEFYKDGSFRIASASIGRGCGTDGIYRPVLRIDLAGDNQIIAEYAGQNKWKTWNKEQWKKHNDATPYSTEGYAYKISNKSNKGFYMEPGRGQFSDGGRGDNAWVYVTRDNPDKEEGHTDLPTIGPCCNTDYKQGPEKFIDPESLDNTHLILWYVPEMQNDDTPGNQYCWVEKVINNGIFENKIYPCYAGPKFVPINNNL